MGGTLVVVNGAVMSCSLGGGPSSLITTASSVELVQGKLMATIQDHQPFTNIPPFSGCRATPNHICSPVTPEPWENPIFSNVLVAPNAAGVLTANCMLRCTVGGEITIQDPGQSTVYVGGAERIVGLTEELEFHLKVYLRATLLEEGVEPNEVNEAAAFALENLGNEIADRVAMVIETANELAKKGQEKEYEAYKEVAKLEIERITKEIEQERGIPTRPQGRPR